MSSGGGGGGALRDAGTMVARTMRRVERGAAWASERVALGNCAAVFARILVWPAGKRDVRYSVARSWRYVGGSRAKGRWPGALRKSCGRSDVWQVALGSSSRVWLEVLVGRGDALFSLRSVCMKRARCATLGRFELRRLSGSRY